MTSATRSVIHAFEHGHSTCSRSQPATFPWAHTNVLLDQNGAQRTADPPRQCGIDFELGIESPGIAVADNNIANVKTCWIFVDNMRHLKVQRRASSRSTLRSAARRSRPAALAANHAMRLFGSVIAQRSSRRATCRSAGSTISPLARNAAQAASAVSEEKLCGAGVIPKDPPLASSWRYAAAFLPLGCTSAV